MATDDRSTGRVELDEQLIGDASARSARAGTRVAHLSTVHRARDNRIFNKEATAVAASGFDTTLIARDAGQTPINGVSMIELAPTEGRLQRMVHGQFRAWKALNRLAPQVVHVHDPELIPTALLWARLHRAGFIYDAHEDLVGQLEDKKYLKPAFKVMAGAYARLILGVANRAADAIVAATPVIAEKFSNPRTATVRNFPWLRDFPKVERKEVEGRVVYIGSLTKARLSDVMLATVLATEGASLVLAGPADAHTQALIDALPADAPIEYRGIIGPHEIPDLLATAAVGFVFLEPLPNYEESLPTKMFEYMAAEVPFIASDFAYWRTLLAAHDAGLFVDTSTEVEPAKALRRLLDDADLRRRMGAAGRAAIEKDFNFEADIAELVATTEGVAERARRR